MSQDELQKQQQLIASLLKPSHYPHPVKKIHLIETHISWVLLAGRFAYKIKKALDLGFMNTLLLDARHRYCAEELRLNRRLAPKLYLDVVSIGGSNVDPELNTQPAIEYAVKMRRFALTNTFDRLIRHGKITNQQIDSLAQTLANFHATLPAITQSDSAEFTSTIFTTLQQNITQLTGLFSDHGKFDMLSTLQTTSTQAFTEQRRYMAQRYAQGFVRECHGDLHLGNIALIRSQPTPFDGINFNPALRRIDVMDEVAFLFMDLLRYQQLGLAYRFLNRYVELNGDYAGLALLHFYASHRALVRAKVETIRAHQYTSSSIKRKNLLSHAQGYIQLAQQLLTLHTPALIITHGLPGSGKSTFAQAALEQLGAIRMRSDVERKRLFNLPALANSHEQNIYSAEATQRTYTQLLANARHLLKTGHSVIVDAAFLRQDEREQFHQLANELQVRFVIVSLQASLATLQDRIINRQALGNDPSEANLAVLQKLSSVQETLSPQELSHTYLFSSEPGNELAWTDLKKFLAVS